MFNAFGVSIRKPADAGDCLLIWFKVQCSKLSEASCLIRTIYLIITGFNLIAFVC